MTTTDSLTWLDEAFASYQPTSMTQSTWERFRVDACELVRQLEPADARAARKCLSRLTVFLADLATARPETVLEDLLTREQVEGHLARALSQGAAGKTIENRQGTLNALLRVKHGVPQPRRSSRSLERHLQPHPVDELLQTAKAAIVDGHPDGVNFARSIACALAGVPLPTPARDHLVKVTTNGDHMQVNDRQLQAPELTGLPSGDLRAAEVERGRAFARRELDFQLDVRRAALTHLTELVRSAPAFEVLELRDVGRDRLTAAVAACGPADASEMRDVLRGAALPTS